MDKNFKIKRFIAGLIDLFIYALIVSVVSYIWFLYTLFDGGIDSTSYRFFYISLALILFLILPLVNKGATIGKSILKLCVINNKGKTPNILVTYFRSTFLVVFLAYHFMLFDNHFTNNYLQTIIFWIMFMSLFNVISTTKGTYLDILFKTKVIYKEELKEEPIGYYSK